jgi:SAM-dependent methyltransferase
MIIRELITYKGGNTEGFFGLQAEESIRWLTQLGITAKSHPKALDLGCGFGFFGKSLITNGYQMTFSDDSNFIHENVPHPYNFVEFDICKDDFAKLGTYDLVISSNVYEHLSNPQELLNNIPKMLNKNGVFYLCWTNWLGLYGGHEYAPYHYLGTRMGNWLLRKLPAKLVIDPPAQKTPPHTLGVNLFPTYIGKTLRQLRKLENVKIIDYVPRYYSEFRWIAHTPILREFLTWNFAVAVKRS